MPSNKQKRLLIIATLLAGYWLIDWFGRPSWIFVTPRPRILYRSVFIAIEFPDFQSNIPNLETIFFVDMHL